MVYVGRISSSSRSAGLCTRRYQIILLLLLGIGILLVATSVAITKRNMEEASGKTVDWSEFWVVRLGLNLLGYATIAVPGYLLIRWVRKTGYLESPGASPLKKLIRLFVAGSEEEKPGVEEVVLPTSTQEPKAEESLTYRCLKLCFCAGGLQGSYLIWGLLQERIMSIQYGGSEKEPGESFKNSQFLVFMNRILAFIIGLLVIAFTQQPRHKAPVYKYSFSSFSNIMSSWCQYEALKFVSFPTQVLAKASKIIPVMLMGKIVSNKTFQYYEYVTAIMISVGISMFLLTSQDTVKDNNTVTTFSGLIILVGYLCFDAFTSNWQGQLFTDYSMSSIQMMLGVNFFSVMFTTVSLVEQGGFIESMAFMGRHSAFVVHVVILSICSASGQLFIFYTISQFGAVTFAIIMTIRQGLAILLSCIFYHHPVTAVGVFGVVIVFSAIFLRMYCNQVQKRKKVKETATVVTPPKL